MNSLLDVAVNAAGTLWGGGPLTFNVEHKGTMLRVNMATSSITHNFVISPEGSKRFAESLERAEELASIPRPHFNGRILTDTSEILAFLAKNRPNGK